MILRTGSLDPWMNLAVEEYLLESLRDGQFILYLWQNQNTVVIGKNQNPWKECRTELLESEGGRLARRLSGGGAVFHDTGNLNFTFLMGRGDYNLDKQLSVILSAVNALGIQAEKTGRNDIAVEGRKFSGNAFCFRKTGAYHHGTLLVSADMEKLSRYLQVSTEKIRSKGIESVRARVANLSEFRPGLAIEEVAEAVSAAFLELYGYAEPVKDTGWMDKNALDGLYDKYSSWQWRYGVAPNFDIELSARFLWGGIDIMLTLEQGKVARAAVYSDAMDSDFIESIPGTLEACQFKSKLLADAVRRMKVRPETEPIVEDIAQWLEEKGF